MRGRGGGRSRWYNVESSEAELRVWCVKEEGKGEEQMLWVLLEV